MRSFSSWAFTTRPSQQPENALPISKQLETKGEFERSGFLEGEQDEHKSDGVRSVDLKHASFERSGGGRPGKPATQRHSNATGEDAAGPNICS
jgi:hypothetical protein